MGGHEKCRQAMLMRNPFDETEDNIGSQLRSERPNQQEPASATSSAVYVERLLLRDLLLQRIALRTKAHNI